MTKILLPEAKLDLFDEYPILSKVSRGDNWQLLVETSEEIYVLHPSTMFWSNVVGAGEPQSRSQSPSLETGHLNLYLEFAFHLIADSHLRSYGLILEHEAVQTHQFAIPLAAPSPIYIGLRFVAPLRLLGGTVTLTDDWAVSEYTELIYAD